MTQLTDEQQKEFNELIPCDFNNPDFQLAVIKLLIQIRDKKRGVKNKKRIKKS